MPKNNYRTVLSYNVNDKKESNFSDQALAKRKTRQGTEKKNMTYLFKWASVSCRWPRL